MQGRLSVIALLGLALSAGAWAQPADALVGLEGNLRDRSEKELVLATETGKVLKFRLLAKTLVGDDRGEPLHYSLHAGDRLLVHVSPDDPETARRVTLLRIGTPAERELAEKPATEPARAAGLEDFDNSSRDVGPPPVVSRPAERPGQAASVTWEGSVAIGPDQVQPGQRVSKPIVSHKVAPEYSPIARNLHASGTVSVRYEVSSDGATQNFKVLRSLGYGLDEKAIESIRNWRYKPGKRDGRAVTVTMIQDFAFSNANGSARDWSSGPMAFAREDGLTPPVVTAGIMPEARAAPEMSVILEFTVEATGSVRNIKSLYGSPAASKASIECLEHWKFAPATRDNQPVDVTARVRFVKEQGDEPPVGTLLNQFPRPPVTPSPDGNSPPAVLVKTDPEYSEEARQAKFSGTVLLQLVIDIDGRAKSIRVTKGVGLGLDEKAIESVQRWIFKPAFRNGQAVRVPSTIEVNFRLL